MEPIPPAPAATAYAARKSVLEPETLWRLTPDALERERLGEAPKTFWGSMVKICWRAMRPFAAPLDADTWRDRVLYKDISSIRVRYDPTRVDRKRERCDLEGPGGARISLFSTHYESFGHFEDRSAAWRAFVNELTRRVLQARPEAAIHSGLSWRAYITQHGLMLLALLAVSSALGAFGAPAFGTIWAKIFIVLSYCGTAWAYAKRNFPRNLNPPNR